MNWSCSMSTSRLTIFAVLALALSSSALAQAPAAEASRAKELFDNGALLYDEGNYQAAIVAFQESYNLSKAPLLMYDIANCQERLGDLKAARDALNIYRAVAPAEERAALERRIANLEDRIAQQAAAPVVVAPVAAPPVVAAPVAQASSAPGVASTTQVPAPERSGRTGLKRGLIVGGAAATVAGVGLGAYGYTRAAAAIDALDRDAYDRAKVLNAVGYGVSGLGLVGAGLGVALPRHADAEIALAPAAGGLRLAFTAAW